MLPLLMLPTSFVTMVSARAQPVLPPDAPTALVSYAEPVDFEHLESLTVRMSLNGGKPHRFLVDTGSTGIVVAARDIPAFDGKGPPGSLTYVSSGRREVGVWTTVDVALPDAQASNGAPVTARVLVLAVTRLECTGRGVNAAGCVPTDNPTPHMLGVGFGRGNTPWTNAQQRNVFVNIKAMETGAMRRGYVISPEGIRLGLSGRTLGPDWMWQKLTRRAASEPRDWETAAGTFEIDGKPAPMGSVLIDTGLTNMMLEARNGPQTGDAPEGSRVRIGLLGGRVWYGFTVGVQTRFTPRRTSWRLATHGTFVNTGLRALEGFDYCYDADEGWLGLRKRQ